MKIKVDDNIGERVDIWLSDKTSYSRSHIKTLIKNGNITINDNQVSPSYNVRNGDLAVIIEQSAQAEVLTSQNIPLDIIYEDDDMVIVNKQAGIVVHPAPGHKDNTIVNAVMFHCNNFNVEDLLKGKLKEISEDILSPADRKARLKILRDNLKKISISGKSEFDISELLEAKIQQEENHCTPFLCEEKGEEILSKA